MKKLIIGILFTSFFLVGCGSNFNPSSPNGPYWVSYYPLNSKSKPVIYYKLTKEKINKQKLSNVLTFIGERVPQPEGTVATWTTNINRKNYYIEVFEIVGVDHYKEVAVKIANGGSYNRAINPNYGTYYKAIVQNKKP